MDNKVDERFKALIAEGEKLVGGIGFDRDGTLRYWVNQSAIPAYQQWMASASNLINIVVPKGNHYSDQVKALLSDKDDAAGISSRVVSKMFGVFKSAYAEWQAGLLRQIEYIVAAGTFDDFLDHAIIYEKANKKVEAAVLASAVLEDVIKKVCAKNSVPSSGKTLDPLIDDLVKEGIFTPVKAKRSKAFTGTRNHALHAEWDKFEIDDVRALIQGIRDLIVEYL